MKLTLRTVSGGTTVFEVTEDETVGSLKAKMAEDYDLPTLKLCHKGKVLDDAKTFKDLGFGEAETLIIAGKKKALVAKAPVQAPAPVPTPAPTSTPPTASGASPEATEQTAPSAPVTATEQVPAPAPSAPVAPPVAPPAAPAAAQGGAPVDEDTVAGIMAMGFDDKAAVVKALQCAFGNPDRAVEYMFSGIPAGVEANFNAQQQQPARSQSVQQQQQQGGSGGAPGGGAPAPGGGEMSAEQLGAMMQQMQQQEQGGGSELEVALRGLPQFDQVRTLIAQNPAALPVVMQQLQQHSPELFALVQANPQEFLDIMGRAPAPGAEGGDGGGGAEGGPSVVQLTPADAEPIQRLVSLGGGGWDARAATIVYLACRRNEEMAANVLLEHGGIPPELADVELQEGGGPSAE